ncbi:chitobiase/beta-hexosaminidase C-terminal domain-containing protein [Corallococcus sp. M34]|uniref:chitobiase/beta-hexosaminidase C-terminal domain-containing protein n=1 Tax=Citreicoccus inhibens TaxID=2849499 RepID=UPI001C23EC1B|nr:chitobiase/beta-hexosaminidase C-terminal domain-containing protein [Citreicoccus inhibens]MBU8896531.1 chitobiase/beta-hexosaminidase C-terminal domain-containing protein [Citreicoccus inhibens]
MPRPFAVRLLPIWAPLALLCLGGCGGKSEPPPSSQSSDTSAPSTHANPTAGTYSNQVSVELTCNDGSGSGCSATYFTRDGSTPTTQSSLYQSAIVVRADTTLRFFSVDKAGNAEAPRQEQYVIVQKPVDTVAPETSASPAGGAFNSSRFVSLECRDLGLGCAATYYTVDGSTPTKQSPRYTAPLIVGQSMQVRFFSVDQAGNVEQVKTEAYVIDTQAPSVSAARPGGKFQGTLSLALSCDDGQGSGCKDLYFTRDGSTPTTSSERYTAPLSLSATTTVRFFAVDLAGNASAPVTEVYVWEPPLPEAAASPRGGVFKDGPQVALTCVDGPGLGPCASIHYTVDGAVPTPASTRYTAPIQLTSSTQLRFLAVGTTGKAGAVVSEMYSLDTVSPVTQASPAGAMYRDPVDVKLLCTDANGCHATYVTRDGSIPTTTSPRYTEPLHLTEETTLRFYSVDVVGNVEAVRSEHYAFDRLPPTTQANPGGGTYVAPLFVALGCDDAVGSGCATTRYTLDGSDPNTSSTALVYANPISLRGKVQLRYASVDKLGNVESAGSQSYTVLDSPGAVSTQIAAVRTSTPGTDLKLPIGGAFVTGVTPQGGNALNDPAGFFLQASQGGSAIFVAVDPTTLSPPLAVGDLVGLTVTAKAVVNGMQRAVAIADLQVFARNQPLVSLVQDVSAVDLVGSAANYEAKLIHVRGALTEDFSGAGPGFVQATLSTAGTPQGPASSANLHLRMLASVQSAQALGTGCMVSVQAPLWLYSPPAGSVMVQPSAWDSSAVSSVTCPAPRVVSARATSQGEVTVRFSRAIAPDSVDAAGSQFSLAPAGVTVTSATVNGRDVKLTTGEHSPTTHYTLWATRTVRDTRGTPMDQDGSTGFLGSGPPAQLRLTEVAPNLYGGRDLFELFVVSAGSVDGMTLVDGSSTLATLPGAYVQAGDVIVIHMLPGTPAANDPPRSELLSPQEFALAHYPDNYDTAWDFLGGPINIAYPGNHLFRVNDPQGVTQDALAVVSGGTQYAPYLGFLQDAQAQGLWLPADCAGLPCTYGSAPSAFNVSADWGISSMPSYAAYTFQSPAALADHSTASDWFVGPSTLGFESF